MVFKTAFELFGHEKCVNTFCAQLFYMPNVLFRLDFLDKHIPIGFQWSVLRIFIFSPSKHIFLMIFTQGQSVHTPKKCSNPVAVPFEVLFWHIFSTQKNENAPTNIFWGKIFKNPKNAPLETYMIMFIQKIKSKWFVWHIEHLCTKFVDTFLVGD